jgi:hypothetical protein
MASIKACPAPDCRAAILHNAMPAPIWLQMERLRNGRSQPWCVVVAAAFTPATGTIARSEAI